MSGVRCPGSRQQRPAGAHKKNASPGTRAAFNIAHQSDPPFCSVPALLAAFCFVAVHYIYIQSVRTNEGTMRDGKGENEFRVVVSGTIECGRQLRSEGDTLTP